MNKEKTKEEKEAEERRNQFNQQIIDQLVEKDIFAHMKKIREMEDVRYRYFRYCSKLWRAIENHIVYAKDCVLLNRENKVMIHRGSYGVTISHLYIYGELANKPSTHFGMNVEVEFIVADQEYEEWPATYKKNYDICVPIELERNFSLKDFNKWIMSCRKKRDQENNAAELAELKRLKAKYEK